MKKIIVLLMLIISVKGSGQVLQKPAVYGYEFRRLAVDTLFAVPADTFSVPAALQSFPFIARKGTSFYFWNTSTHVWAAFSAAGATPTWQQVLTAGSTLTTNNTGIHTGYNFQLYSEQGTKQQIIRSLTDSTLGMYLRNLSSNDLAYFYLQGSDTSANIKGGSNLHGSGIKLADNGEFHTPTLGNFYIDSLPNLSTQNTLLGWKQGSGQGQVGYVTLGSGLSLSSGVLSSSDITADTVLNYTQLRAYSGSAKILILTDSVRGGTFYYTGESENGATVIDGWRRVFDGKHYKPEWFEIGGKDMNGASYNRLTGTGIGSWGKAIAQICRLAGPDAIIDYKPGFQYPIDRLIPIKQNQVHSGGYLKRAAPVWTLLSNNEAIGSTTIEVADASSLQAGMLFLIKGAGTDGSHGDNSNGTTGVEWHEILSISGNTLTISGSVYRIEKAMLAGDTLITVAPLLYRENSILGASDSDYIVICRDMTFDGNYPQNNKIIDYQQPPTIGMYDGYVIANNCTFMNIPGENIYTAGGSITDCFADSIQGSFGHGTANLSTLDSIYHEFVVTNLKARDVGWGQAELQGHSEGRLWTNSTKTKNARFINCTMINSSRGTGRGKSIWNGNQDDGIIQVIGGYYKNSTGIMDLSGGDSLTAKGRMVIIQNAKFDNCGYLQITGNDVKRGNGLKSVSLLNNDFTNTRSYFDQIAVLDIIGNKFHSDSANNVINDSRASGTGTTTWFFGTGQWTMLFLTANMDRVNIDGNYFEGYRNDSLLNGVQLTLNDSTYRKEGTQMTDYYYCRSLNFSNNTIENFRYLTALSQTSFAKQTDWRMDNNKGYILWHPDYVSDYTYGLLIPPGANGNNNWFITPYMNNYSFPYIVYGVKSTGNYQKLRGGTLTNSKAEGGNYPFNVDPFNASPYHCVLKNNTGYSGTIRWGTDANTYKLGDSGNDIFTNATLTNYTAPKRFGIGENKTNY